MSSNLGIVRRSSLQGATLALLINRLLHWLVVLTIYAATSYALLEASTNICNSDLYVPNYFDLFVVESLIPTHLFFPQSLQKDFPTDSKWADPP